MDKNIINTLKSIMGQDTSIIDIAPGRLQIAAPFFHADGDPMEIYAYVPDNSDTVMLSDCGMTLMRLSYTERITDSTLNKIEKLVNQYRFNFDNGEICVETPIKSLRTYVSNFALTISKIMGLSELSQNKPLSDFKMQIEKFIMESLIIFEPEKNYTIDEKDSVIVDYRLTPPEKSNLQLFVFPVNNTAKATEVWGTLQFCLKTNVNFRSMVACENFQQLSKAAQHRMTNNSDGIFLSLPDFYSFAEKKINRIINF